MNTKLTSVPMEDFKEMKWIEVVLFLTDFEYFNTKKINRWVERFSRVTVACQSDPERLPQSVNWYSIGENETRSEVWNRLTKEAKEEWILFIEDDEVIRFSSIPEKSALDDKKWPPVLIKQHRQSSNKQYYQTRLVNAKNQMPDIYDGRGLPDSTRYIRENEITFLNHPIVIDRGTSPAEHVDINNELSEQKYPPKLYLVQGSRLFREKKYVQAAAQYRKLLKEKELLPFDRLGAVNGLASCLAEQNKWSKALTLAEESIKAEKLQNLPYLIQYRIHELKKEWEKAYKYLLTYYECFSLYSRASFDSILGEEKTLINIANVALKADKRREAAKYFEKLFTIKEEVDESLLRKVLLLSIELDDYDRSTNLFEQLFKERLPHNLDEEGQGELDKIMTLFMEREWYDYVSKVYNNLHDAHPQNRSYKRRLIVTLTKTNRLDRAKTMLGSMVK